MRPRVFTKGEILAVMLFGMVSGACIAVSVAAILATDTAPVPACDNGTVAVWPRPYADTPLLILGGAQ